MSPDMREAILRLNPEMREQLERDEESRVARRKAKREAEIAQWGSEARIGSTWQLATMYVVLAGFVIAGILVMIYGFVRFVKWAWYS